MIPPSVDRPNPDDLLSSIRLEDEQRTRPRLKVFFGMCAGVGKTFEMLRAAHEAKARGLDVVIGYVETHRRVDTERLLDGLEIVPRLRGDYKGVVLEEMDLDAILRRRPKLVLVDELAHTNVPGSRHTKRYQDVEELLNNGIDVYTTLNVQHVESRADTVAQITGAPVQETVPDSILERADDIEVVDISPDGLLRRLVEGKVYVPERSQVAAQHFFRKGNLTALREMSLRITAERVDRQLRAYMRAKRIAGPWKTGNRLIVGISASPHSANLIRWARQIASTQDTSWVAVHVETSRETNGLEKAELARNIKLAQELGAEVISTADESVVDALIRVAKQENCTQILIGKSRRHLLRGAHGFAAEVIGKSGDLDVYIVGGEPAPKSISREWLSAGVRSGVLQYALAAAIVLCVALICYPLSGHIGYQTVALILLLTVALLPLRLGVGPVLLAAAVSALTWDFAFVTPLFTFSIGRIEDVLMLFAYICVASVSGVLTSRARAQERAVRLREDRAMALYTLSRDLSLARTKDAVASAAVANVKRFFNAEAAICLGHTDGDIFSAAHPASSFPLSEKDLAVAAWVYWNEKKAGRHTDTLSQAYATYLPISGPRYCLGVLGIRLHGDHEPTLDQSVLLENFVQQIASALERETLNEITKKALIIEESERLSKTLISSISHEFRTPLAAIIGSSETLLDDSVSRPEELSKELLGEIRDAAGRLNRLVENLLDMTRLESGLIRAKLDWCDVHDLVGGTLRKMTKELAGHTVTVRIAADFPLVKIDFPLLEQVVTNLLLNASLYTPPGGVVEIGAREESKEWVLTVKDSGPGIPPGEEEKIFEKFYRVPGSRTGGTGLGLSIVRGFVQAHRGTVTAERCAEGGTRFTVRLPLDRVPSSQE
jgi:two-component system, OmpR family, sensor histidine kinase KdpD